MPDTIPVTVDTFARAESDLYFSTIALKEGGFGKFEHHREVSPIDDQNVIRLNRDTLYSAAVFDLDAGPVTITLPDAGGRFMSLQIISEDHYTLPTLYEPGRHTITREQVGTRYVLVGVRTLVDPNDPADIARVHALQDGLLVDQPGGSGSFETPAWDPSSQKTIRDALITLAATVADTSGTFGVKSQVDPIRHLIGTASAWGGNSAKDALYLNVVPAANDGKTAYRLSVKDVPVDGFWSVIVYDRQGYIPKNGRGVYSFNNVTAKQDPDGSTTIQFGGDPARAANCIPIVEGWNYMVRLYRPRPEILDGRWVFPEAQPIQ